MIGAALYLYRTAPIVMSGKIGRSRGGAVMNLIRIVEKPVFMTRIREEDVKLKEMALGYLLAPFCAMVSAAVFGAYLNRYYVDVLGWTRFGVFTMLLPVFSSVLVILGNLMIGRWIDRTRTTQGKARPYLLLSCPMAAAAIILLFMTPSDVPDPFQMAWIAVSYILYHAVAYPCFYTAHSSMVSLSTRNTEQRDFWPHCRTLPWWLPRGSQVRSLPRSFCRAICLSVPRAGWM